MACKYKTHLFYQHQRCHVHMRPGIICTQENAFSWACCFDEIFFTCRFFSFCYVCERERERHLWSKKFIQFNIQPKQSESGRIEDFGHDFAYSISIFVSVIIYLARASFISSSSSTHSYASFSAFFLRYCSDPYVSWITHTQVSESGGKKRELT